MSREDQTEITVIIERSPGVPWPGLGNIGVFENRTGGNAGADSTKHREGGMGPLRSYGGPQTFENVQVSRRRDPTRDGSIYKALLSARGRARMVVIEQTLDEFGVAFGEPVTYAGKLLEVNGGETNANSNDIRMLELTQDTDSIT